MQSAVLIFILSILTSLPLLAESRRSRRSDTEMTVPYPVRVRLATRGEVETIQKLSARVKAGDRSLCVGYRGSAMSGCAQALIRSYRVHSAEGLRAMLDLAVAAAIKDRASGDGHAEFFLAENLLTVAESVRPQKFFAKKIRAKTVQERQWQRQARSDENQRLESFRAQALPQIETYLNRLKHSELRERYERLRARRWSVG